jgi:hypothetical protein
VNTAYADVFRLCVTVYLPVDSLATDTIPTPVSPVPSSFHRAHIFDVLFARTDPSTCSLELGEADPIPTFPVFVTVSLAAPPDKTCTSELNEFSCVLELDVEISNVLPEDESLIAAVLPAVMWKFVFGSTVPIPTFPVDPTVIRGMLLVLMLNGFCVTVPAKVDPYDT